MKQVEFTFESDGVPTRATGRPATPVLTVAEASGAIRELLEGTFPRLSVRGEISGLSRPQSGHIYFTLIDDGGVAGGRARSAKLPCVVWRSAASRLRSPPVDGMRVVVSGRIGVYEPRGSYQLIGETLEPVGLGELHRQFEELKERLQAEGLFDAERKRPLPFLPRRIGLVTSAGGAAIQDFLRMVYRRSPRAWVRLVPTRVQGQGAAREIAAALAALNGAGVDTIVLTRGGGSLEDLWPFNEEVVARAIAASQVPVVSAVGHEVDVTIADFTADARAQTPTQAAELVVPDRAELRDRLVGLASRISLGCRANLRRAETKLLRTSGRRPYSAPEVVVEERVARCDDVDRRLQNALYKQLSRWDDAVRSLAGRLSALSPLRVLSRGYAVLQKEDGAVVRDVVEVEPGARLRALVGRGAFDVRVMDADQDQNQDEERTPG